MSQLTAAAAIKRSRAAMMKEPDPNLSGKVMREKTFPEKTHQAITDCNENHPGIAVFYEEGGLHGFIVFVKNLTLLIEVLKKYGVCQSKDKGGTPQFSSFRRQLNQYGFQLINKPKENVMIFLHKENLFRKDSDVKSLKQITRAPTKKKGCSTDANDVCTNGNNCSELKSDVSALKESMKQQEQKMDELTDLLKRMVNAHSDSVRTSSDEITDDSSQGTSSQEQSVADRSTATTASTKSTDNAGSEKSLSQDKPMVEIGPGQPQIFKNVSAETAQKTEASLDSFLISLSDDEDIINQLDPLDLQGLLDFDCQLNPTPDHLPPPPSKRRRCSFSSMASSMTSEGTTGSLRFDHHRSSEYFIATSDNDVFCDDEGLSQSAGNQRHNALVSERRALYSQASAQEKDEICHSIVEEIKQHGGLFLRKVVGPGPGNPGRARWYQLSDEEAKEVTAYALEGKGGGDSYAVHSFGDNSRRDGGEGSGPGDDRDGRTMRKGNDPSPGGSNGSVGSDEGADESNGGSNGPSFNALSNHSTSLAGSSDKRPDTTATATTTSTKDTATTAAPVMLLPGQCCSQNSDFLSRPASLLSVQPSTCGDADMGKWESKGDDGLRTKGWNESRGTGAGWANKECEYEFCSGGMTTTTTQSSTTESTTMSMMARTSVAGMTLPGTSSPCVLVSDDSNPARSQEPEGSDHWDQTPPEVPSDPKFAELGAFRLKSAIKCGDCLSEDTVEERTFEKGGRGVSFSHVSVRKYHMVLGDHPVCSSGPPVTLGWEFQPEPPVYVDEYESHKRERRNAWDLIMSPGHRREVLTQAAGHTEWEIQEALRGVKEVKRQRQKSVHGLPFIRIQEVIHATEKRLRKLRIHKKNCDPSKSHDLQCKAKMPSREATLSCGRSRIQHRDSVSMLQSRVQHG